MSSRRSPQRRDGDRKDVQAVEQVAPKRAGPLRRIEVLVAGGDDPDVHRDGGWAAEPLDALLLEDAQQFGLHVQRQLADLVEEDRGAVRHLEPADLLGERAGVRALLAAEELALDQRVRDGRTVHVHHGARAPRAERMNRGGESSLSGPGLAEQEHGRRRWRHLLDLREGAPDRRAAPDDLRRRGRSRGLAEVPVLVLQLVSQARRLIECELQPLLRHLAVGDVEADPEHAVRRSLRIICKGPPAYLEPPHRPVRPQQPVLVAVGGLALARPPHAVADTVTILRVNELEHVLQRHVRGRLAVHRVERRPQSRGTATASGRGPTSPRAPIRRRVPGAQRARAAHCWFAAGSARAGALRTTADARRGFRRPPAPAGR